LKLHVSHGEIAGEEGERGHSYGGAMGRGRAAGGGAMGVGQLLRCLLLSVREEEEEKEEREKKNKMKEKKRKKEKNMENFPNLKIFREKNKR
jgi:hypothetical protein